MRHPGKRRTQRTTRRPRTGRTRPALRNLDVFHDREGFTTVWSSKSFAIMKIRSGVRIAAADRGSRAGYARPGIAEPRAGPGMSGFPQATTVRTTSDRAVSRTSVLLPDARPQVRVVAATTSLGPAAGQPPRPQQPGQHHHPDPRSSDWTRRAILAVSRPGRPGPSVQTRPTAAPAAIRNRDYLVP